MATSGNAQLLLLSMKCTSARLLRLALALLLPLLLAFLLPLSSLLNPASIFLLVNLLVLAIVLLSSASSSHSSSPDHNNAVASPSTPPSHSLYTSSSYSPESISRSLPEEVSIQRSKVEKETPTAQSAAAASKLSCSCPSDDQFKSRGTLPASAFVPVSSQDTILKSPSPVQLLQNLEAAIAASDGQMNRYLAITKRPSEEQLKKQPAIKGPAQQKYFATASLDRSSDLMVRSRSDQSICAGETTRICTKTLRRTETVESAVDLRTGSESKSSSMIYNHAPSFESLVDDDFTKRCEKFIAHNYEKWKQESLVCTIRPSQGNRQRLQ